MICNTGSGRVWLVRGKQGLEFVRFSASQVLMSYMLGKQSGKEALTSEKVHEVLSHIAVGRENPADAGRPLGPRLARWALDSVGQPLQQALTCKTPGRWQRSLSDSQHN